jgi:hypothetical protein
MTLIGLGIKLIDGVLADMDGPQLLLIDEVFSNINLCKDDNTTHQKRI